MFHGALSALDLGADTVAAEKLSECDRDLNANLVRRGFENINECWLGCVRAIDPDQVR